jgi:tRNA nucleotidyltransferase/poly(A) polymerase
MDAAGTLFDYAHGSEDLSAQAIRFIGDPVQRIAEDGLRILRFFRFLASHGKPPADKAALAACAAKKDMIATLSGERVAMEMRKLLGAENPAFALRLMQESGVAHYVFGRQIDPSRMIRLHLLESKAQYQCSVWARIVVLLEAGPKDAEWLNGRWKLARHEYAQLRLLASLAPFAEGWPRHAHTRLLRLHGAPAYLDWLLGQAALQPGIDVAPYVALAKEFVAPEFPVAAKDLMATGMKEGKALGDRLAALERAWEESDYTLSREELLALGMS